MCYKLLRQLLFCLPPETAHHVTLKGLDYLDRTGLLARFYPPVISPITIAGLSFQNRVGLAAGLDKNGEHITALGHLGFGFLEVGTTTPLPQAGNPRPRLFRLPQEQALINRMGFNNQGIDALIEHVKQAQYSGPLGINLGKNASTPIENALNDYLIGLEKAYAYADYITINISSPNTANLRSLHYGKGLIDLLTGLKAKQAELTLQTQKKVPLFIKIAPDLTPEEALPLAETLLRFNIEGLIVSNTTLSRDGVTSTETGGLSGEPLFKKSTALLALMHQALHGKIPLIAAGGIMSPAQACAKIEAGASLVQIYTGFIYQGPSLIRAIARALAPYKQ